MGILYPPMIRGEGGRATTPGCCSKFRSRVHATPPFFMLKQGKKWYKTA